MTVKELKQALDAYGDNLEVCFNAYSMGLNHNISVQESEDLDGNKIVEIL